ncbi:M20/M25/M40 family metallo-hydrolase [Microbacterium aurantiacum]|uniref:M20/M25/M40 family metallo-hydrolase n=1 Tax=Microbacterium aurantiacum TaxID=162393 RepID=UPI003D738E8D
MSAAPGPAAEAVQIAADLIRFDTSNYGDGRGPGERAAAGHVAALLREVGIEPVLFESAPGRTSVVAHWGDRTSNRGGLLLHGHLDVVPAEAADWRFDPFGGVIDDGFLYGRGAVDMKDFLGMMLSVVRDRARTGRIPDRPITLAFTADEEAGGKFGAHWLVDEHSSLFDGCTEAVGEIGGFSTFVADRRLYLIESGEKGIAWVHFESEGTAGHGSMRQPDNAVEHLVKALGRVAATRWPADPGPTMRALLHTVRELSGVDNDDPDVILAETGPTARMLSAAIRNNTNVTMLDAGYKHNVVPGSAAAAVDGRFLPGQQEQFLEELDRLAGEEATVTVRRTFIDRAVEYPFEGRAVDAMREALRIHDPEAAVAPYLVSGGSDAKAWDRLGIRCYGFVPLPSPPSEDFTALFHGVDERVSVAALEAGSLIFDTFLDLC